MEANEAPQQYIPKSALLAEIERTQKRLNLDDIGGRSVMAWSEGFKNFIDTLEVKEVDLDKELESWRHNHFHGRRDKEADDEYLERLSQLDLAKHFFELGMKMAQKGEEL